MPKPTARTGRLAPAIGPGPGRNTGVGVDCENAGNATTLSKATMAAPTKFRVICFIDLTPGWPIRGNSKTEKRRLSSPPMVRHFRCLCPRIQNQGMAPGRCFLCRRFSCQPAEDRLRMRPVSRRVNKTGRVMTIRRSLMRCGVMPEQPGRNRGRHGRTIPLRDVRPSRDICDHESLIGRIKYSTTRQRTDGAPFLPFDILLELAAESSIFNHSVAIFVKSLNVISSSLRCRLRQMPGSWLLNF